MVKMGKGEKEGEKRNEKAKGRELKGGTENEKVEEEETREENITLWMEGAGTGKVEKGCPIACGGH